MELEAFLEEDSCPIQDEVAVIVLSLLMENDNSKKRTTWSVFNFVPHFERELKVMFYEHTSYVLAQLSDFSETFLLNIRLNIINTINPHLITANPRKGCMPRVNQRFRSASADS